MESQVVSSLSKRLGIDTPGIVKKATEFVRLTEVRCGSLNALNLNGGAKAVICLEIAAICSNVPVDKGLSVKLSGMTKKAYMNAYKSIEHMLDRQKLYTVHDLAIQFGCLEAAKLAEQVLSRYKVQCVGQVDTDFTQPIFPAASLYSVCRHQKRRVDKSKLLGSVGVKKSMFDKLCQEMHKIIQQVVDEKISTGSKRSYSLLDRVNQAVGDSYFRVQEILREFNLEMHVDKNGYKFIDKILEEQEHCIETKHRRTSDSDKSGKDLKTLEYEEWKRRILEAADEAIADEERMKKQTVSDDMGKVAEPGSDSGL